MVVATILTTSPRARETKDEMKSRQVLPRDQLAKQAMQRQTVAAKREFPASTCSEWLGVTST